MFKNKFGISKEDFVVIFAGRLVDGKGALETIKAVKACDDKAIKLLIVGAGFYSSDIVDNYTLELRKEAEAIKDRIIFTGYIDYDDMPSIYQLGDVAVLPSMWDEPAGMTMVEAVVSGLPLITTNSGGIPEYMIDGSALLLERNENLVDEISQWIINFKQGSDLRKQYHHNGEKLAEESNLDNYYKNFQNIITY